MLWLQAMQATHQIANLYTIQRGCVTNVWHKNDQEETVSASITSCWLLQRGLVVVDHGGLQRRRGGVQGFLARFLLHRRTLLSFALCWIAIIVHNTTCPIVTTLQPFSFLLFTNWALNNSRLAPSLHIVRQVVCTACWCQYTSVSTTTHFSQTHLRVYTLE